MKDIYFLTFFIIAFIFVLSSCQTNENQSAIRGNNVSFNELTKVKMTFKQTEIIVAISDNGASRDFVSMLPLTLTFEDYAATEKVSDLPRKLSTDNAPSGTEPVTGDFTYFSPWGNLAIFYQDFRYSNGLIPLGKIESDFEHLNNIDGHEVLVEEIN
jgi:hypothetical protein